MIADMIATNALTTVSTDLADLADRLRASVVQVHAGERGIGSGVVWSATAPDATGQSELTIITNAHVVLAARGSNLAVKLLGGLQGRSQNAPTEQRDAQGRSLPATVHAVDPSHDLASLRVKATLGPALQVAWIGDSTALRIGELVVAVGNPFGREGAMTVGVVAARAPVDLEESAEHAEPIAPDAPAEGQERQPGRGRHGFAGGQRRRLETEVIQADIRLYPGNSGGPLADAAGRVVGINSMIVGGLGFSIPSHTVRAFLAQAENAMQRPYLGVELLTVPLSPAQQTRIQAHIQAHSGAAHPTVILVTGIEPGSPAQEAGVLIGDLLLAVNGQALAQAQQLQRALARIAGEETSVTLALLRGEARIELRLTPELRAAA